MSVTHEVISLTIEPKQSGPLSAGTATSASSMSPAIEVAGLSFFYGTRRRSTTFRCISSATR